MIRPATISRHFFWAAIWRCLALVGGMLSGLIPAPQAEAQPFPDIIAELKPSVVAVAGYDPIRQPPGRMLGTGFGVADGHYVVTNNHVTAQSESFAEKEYLVVLVGQGMAFEMRTADIVKTDPVHDLALLRISGAPIPAVQLGGRVRNEAEGTDVAITGFPLGPVLGLFPVTHRGIISSISPNLIPQPNASALQPEMIRASRFNVYMLDMTSYPGNSGSPLYRIDSGEVVGILNSAFVQITRESGLQQPSGISYAIPVEYIHRLLHGAGLK